MSKALEHLDFVANVFVERPWSFTSDTSHLKHIRHTYETKGFYVWYRRLWAAIGPNLWGPRTKFDKWFYDSWLEKVHPVNIAGTFLGSLVRPDNLPDGWVPEAHILTDWWEHGHYVALMNPEVGNAVLDFLRDRPEDKHAVRIRELIEAAYKRLPAKEDT